MIKNIPLLFRNGLGWVVDGIGVVVVVVVVVVVARVVGTVGRGISASKRKKNKHTYMFDEYFRKSKIYTTLENLRVSHRCG